MPYDVLRIWQRISRIPICFETRVLHSVAYKLRAPQKASKHYACSDASSGAPSLARGREGGGEGSARAWRRHDNDPTYQVPFSSANVLTLDRLLDFLDRSLRLWPSSRRYSSSPRPSRDSTPPQSEALSSKSSEVYPCCKDMPHAHVVTVTIYIHIYIYNDDEFCARASDAPMAVKYVSHVRSAKSFPAAHCTFCCKTKTNKKQKNRQKDRVFLCFRVKQKKRIV